MASKAFDERDHPTTVGAILLLISGAVLFAITDGLSKLLAGNYAVGQLVWARYAFAVPIVLVTARPADWPGLLRCERPALQAGRGLLPVLANTTAVIGVSLLPLADFTAISFISPLLLVALSGPLLGERVTVHGWAGVAVGFAGILVIVRPGAGTLAWVALFPLATALILAFYQVLTRLVSRADPPVVTLAWTILVGLVAATSVLPFDWRPVTRTDWPLLALSGLAFGGGQFLLIQAFANAPAPVLAPFSYVQIVAAVIFGIAVFGQVPDLWTVLGSVLVALAGIYVLRSQLS